MTLLPDDPPPAVEATGAIEYTESTAVTAAPGHHDGLNKAPAAAKHDNKDTAEGAVPCITADPARLSDEAQVDQPAGKDASVKSDGPANKDSGETVLATETTAQKAKKKKRGGRNGGKSIEARGPTALPKSRGTGLEEFYADPPITPQEYDEEKEIYASYRPFHTRIEECIQRFRARRRLDGERTLFFNRYLNLGGVDTSARMFTGTAGLDKSDVFREDVTGSDIRAMAADDIIPHTSTRFYSSNRPQDWEVDFTGVAAGYLSYHLTNNTGACLRLTHDAIDVVDNFLRYISCHDVCPEYQDDVNKARALCAQAAVELPACYSLVNSLPGDFNTACRIFCPADENAGLWSDAGLAYRMDEGFDPLRVFLTTVALQPLVGAKAQALADDRKKLETLRVVSTEEMALELVDISQPSEGLVKAYAGVKVKEGATGRIQPVGLATFRHCHIQDGWVRTRPSTAELAARPPVSILLEKNLLDMLDAKPRVAEKLGTQENFLSLVDLEAGIKLRAEVCELSCGIFFFKHVHEVYPSFYTFLPQELMFGYKEPLPNPRPAPSVENPDADEEAEMQMAADEIEQGEKAEKAAEVAVAA